MTDEIPPGDPLNDVLNVLRQPVPVFAGIGSRAVTRRNRQRRGRISGGLGLLLLVALVELAMRRRASATTVTFSIAAPAVTSVALVGDFTDWRSDRVQLERSGTGTWQATVRLAPGRYRFAYLLDNSQWRADSNAPLAPDDFGRPTSIVTVAGN